MASINFNHFYKSLNWYYLLWRENKYLIGTLFAGLNVLVINNCNPLLFNKKNYKNVKRKIALITGITGQDGSYLAELLIKGYEVHGIKEGQVVLIQIKLTTYIRSTLIIAI